MVGRGEREGLTLNQSRRERGEGRGNKQGGREEGGRDGGTEGSGEGMMRGKVEKGGVRRQGAGLGSHGGCREGSGLACSADGEVLYAVEEKQQLKGWTKKTPRVTARTYQRATRGSPSQPAPRRAVRPRCHLVRSRPAPLQLEAARAVLVVAPLSRCAATWTAQLSVTSAQR